MNEHIGRQLGNYRLLRSLGSGGFANVYLGQHIHMDTLVAIKVLKAQLSGEAEARFLQEARDIAKLVHPNIVRVLDFNTQEEISFLVMDYAPAGSLRRLHPKGSRLSLPQIIVYVHQIAAALQYAHEQKLVHRDVKPENMLMGERGEALLSDFGIATIAHSTGSLVHQTFAGTALYTAPEQFQGHPRPSSDQYSLGIVVYEWLCGSPPFQGSSIYEILMKHRTTSPPPPRATQPTIPPEVERVVLKALAKDPRERYTSVLAFAQALEQAYRTSPASFQERAHPMEPRTSLRPSDAASSEAIERQKTGKLAEQPREPTVNQTTSPSLPDHNKSVKSLEPAQQPTQHRQTRRSILLMGAGVVTGAVIGSSVTYFASPLSTPVSPKKPAHRSSPTIIGAWRGPDHDERLLWSTFDGHTWGPEQLVTSDGSVGSSLGPTLVAWQGKLYLARKGFDNDTNIFWGTFNKDTSSWNAQLLVTFSNGDTPATNSTVALAPWQDKLYLAWKGGGNDTTLYWSAFDGRTWTVQQPIFIGTSVGPALAALPNKLYMAWKGTDNDPTIYWSSFDGHTWTPQQKVPASIEGTSDSPALAVFQGKLYMAWQGSNDMQLYWSVFDGSNWVPLKTVVAGSTNTPTATYHTNIVGGTEKAPCLIEFNNKLYMFWKGITNDPRFFWSTFDGNSWTLQQNGALGGISDRPTLAVL